MIAFLDLETTGLIPAEEAILEVGLIITEDNLDTICSMNTIVKPVASARNPLDHMDPVVVEMHTKNGLLEDVKHHGIRRYQAEEALVKFMGDLAKRRGLEVGVGAMKMPIAGNSVGFDRDFLKVHMPTFHKLFHRRTIDVSSFNEMAQRKWPELYALRPKGETEHRAFADAQASIKYLRYYLDNLNAVKLPQIQAGTPYTLVIVESPFAPKAKKPEGMCFGCMEPPHHIMCDYCTARVDWNADLTRNVLYARAAMKDALKRGEAPYASHLLYTQDGVLDDTKPDEREWGIQAGFAWRQVASKTAVYTDLGISKGMQYGIDDAAKRGTPVEYRELGPNWMELLK